MWSTDTSIGASLRSSIVGLAYTGQICQSSKYSISEERGGFANLIVRILFKIIKFKILHNIFLYLKSITHEIGHK